MPRNPFPTRAQPQAFLGFVRVLPLAPAILALCFSSPLDSAEDRAGVEFFERKIRPVLIEHCYRCHSALANQVQGGLLLDSRESLRKGGDSGPILDLETVEASPLLQALRHESLKMPPDRALPSEIVADFAHWIARGAPDPRVEPADAVGREKMARDDRDAYLRQWWSLQPVVSPPIPAVRDEAWSSRPIDRFVLARLERERLAPARQAGRAALVRRLAFALTGLPPDPSVVDRFVADPSGDADAWEKLVSHFLDSPQFGERWARHWLDVVRYTDTYGYEWDMPAKGGWRYRDYLIRALNADVPFDQLVREQIAGDLLEQPRVDPVEQTNQSLIGPMFYQLGEKRHGDSAEFDGIHQEMLDNKIDAFSKAFLAQTVACARCHDHKLDAVLQAEYYALGGLFMSSRWVTNTLDLPERNAVVFQQLRETKRRLRHELSAAWRGEMASLADVMQPMPSATVVDDARRAAWQPLLTPDAQEPPLEDPRHAWFHLVRIAQRQGDVAARWRELTATYAEARKQRVATNNADFLLAADFRAAIPEGWSIDGVGLREPVRAGDFTVALDGPAAIGSVLPAGRFTHALSPRLNGAIRTPQLRSFQLPFLTFEHVGGDFAAHRTVVDNAFLTERQVYLNQPQLGWLLLSTVPSMAQRRVYLELATKTSNPNFPPRVGLGGPCSEEQASDPRSWLGVTRAFLHSKPLAPADELSRFESLFAGEAPGDLAGALARIVAWFQASLQRWERDEATDDDVRVIHWLLANGQLGNRIDSPARPALGELVAEYRRVEKQVLEPQTVNGMADIEEGHDLPLNIRGDYDRPGDPVPRGSVHAFSPTSYRRSSPGSGRRELAEIVASPENPLTARVFVNRVWHWLFGMGLVATTSDFGHAGELPSHPELLDHLATRFVEQGWSIKWLVREIVLTQTWRQDSEVTAAAREIDPNNRLLHHFPLRRLEAEAIRDAMLAVSGRLDAQLYGPPVNPHRQNEDPQKRLFSGPVDGNGRRSIYTKLTIMEPPRFLALFNQPAPKIPTGARDVTNTPAQSLALLNDPFVQGQARHWAERLVKTPTARVEDRITEMFRSAFGRQPAPDELVRWLRSVDDLAQLHDARLQNVESRRTAGAGGAATDAVATGGSRDVLGRLDVWTDVAHAMLNTKEFIYVR